MTFSWRKRRARGRHGASKDDDQSLGIGITTADMELTIPTHFRCPISLDLMKDPVTLSTGITYDRESIERWIEAGNQTCPVTNQVLRSCDQIPNHAIRKMIQDWCVDNKSYGIERIPTPRIPISPFEVSDICSKLAAATQSGDQTKSQELLAKIKTRARESERNKRCILENGTGCVLAASFELLASRSRSVEKHTDVLKEILSMLTWMFPLGDEGQSKLGSKTSLRCMAWFLKGEDLSARQNAVLVLKGLLGSGQGYAAVDGVTEIEGLAESLFKIVEEPICPAATKAALMVIYNMMSSSSSSSSNHEKMTSKFVDMGLASLILEILVDGEKSICEKGLAVLDSISDSRQGRENACAHALAIPLLVKKIMRVSDLATEHSVSILWKLCRSGEEDKDLIIEALQMGAFQKLLVVLQVGCGERTKEKATELLKMMNLYRDSLDCFDSSTGFKYLKRPY